MSVMLFLTLTLDPKQYADEETAFEDSRIAGCSGSSTFAVDIISLAWLASLPLGGIRVWSRFFIYFSRCCLVLPACF
ncbi:MAG TPA: hypothetical protein VNX46_04315 [Candidatus Acidoferrum sp.]|jgi:hypothetical protein|nr:hypothetical protein [Candidatus Acidoferrum sp.]